MAQEIVTADNGTEASTTALAVSHPRPLDAYEPRNLDEARELAASLVRSGLLGQNIKTADQALTLMVAGKELGVRSMQALRSIHIISGKPTLAADLMVALCKRSPECRYFQKKSSDDTQATYETHRVGDPQPTRLTFTLADAKKAHLDQKETWKSYPRAMLEARCKSGLARDVYPDLFMGVYDPDELSAPSSSPPDDRPTMRVVDSTVVIPDDIELDPDTDDNSPPPPDSPEVARARAEMLAILRLMESKPRLAWAQEHGYPQKAPRPTWGDWVVSLDAGQVPELLVSLREAATPEPIADTSDIPF